MDTLGDNGQESIANVICRQDVLKLKEFKPWGGGHLLPRHGRNPAHGLDIRDAALRRRPTHCKASIHCIIQGLAELNATKQLKLHLRNDMNTLCHHLLNKHTHQMSWLSGELDPSIAPFATGSGWLGATPQHHALCYRLWLAGS